MFDPPPYDEMLGTCCSFTVRNASGADVAKKLKDPDVYGGDMFSGLEALLAKKMTLQLWLMGLESIPYKP